MKHDIKSLPKWAQDRILTAEANAQVAELRMKEILGDGDGSFIKMPTGIMKSINLPTNEIDFKIPHKSGLGRVTVMRRSDGSLYVNGLFQLSIEPQASNSFVIRFKEN